MNPTRLNSATINSSNVINDFRYFPIDPMNPTAVACNVGAGGGGVADAPNTLNAAATISTASGSLLHVIPLQMTNHGQGAAATTIATTGLMPQMAILTTPAQAGRVTTVSQPNSNLAYQQIQMPQQLHMAAPASYNVLVNEAGFITDPTFVNSFVATDSSSNMLATIANVGNVSLQLATTSTSSFVLPTATISTVPISDQQMVKEIVIGPTAAAETAIKRTLLPTPQQKITQLNKQQKTIINSTIQQLPVGLKSETIPHTMTTNNFNKNSLEKNVTTFTLPAGTALAKVRPAPYSTIGNTTTAPSATGAASSAVPQIYSTAAPSIENTANVTLKFTPKPAEVACVTVENNDNSVNYKQEVQMVSKISSIQRSTASKQESLLKSKPVQRIIKEQTSPRTKRSKSLNSAVIVTTEDASLERRRSTASEGNVTFSHSDPNTTTAIVTTTCEHIDGVENEKKLEACVKEEIASNECSEYEEEYLEEESTEDENSSNASELMLCADETEILETNSHEEEILSPEKSIENKSTAEEDQQQNCTEDDLQQKTVEAVAPVDHKQQFSTDNVFKIKEEPLPECNDNIPDQPDITMEKLKEEKPQIEQITPNKSLFCDEHILVTSSSSMSASSASTNNSLKEVNQDATDTDTITLETDTLKCNKAATTATDINSYSTVLEMLSTFNMLSWKERIGTARGTNLRFQLNEFNLLQIHERCSPRYHIHTAYEKPIYERESHSIENTGPFLYLCRRCNCHGPAADFLAPEFCSLECLKRDTRKRQRDLAGIPTRKRPRKEAPLASVVNATNCQPTPTLAKPQSTPSLLVKKYFRWSTYLTGKHGEIAAPVDLFLNPFPTGPNSFTIGMKLEAIDPENCSLFCVCTVVDIKGYRLNLMFDGYDPMYNFWVNADSMDIFPPGWCAKTNRILQPPRGIEAVKFNWPAYFAREKAVAAPRQLFTHLNSSSLPMRNAFQIGMHLEAEDLNDTGKLCVATVSDVLDDRIRIHFNGWDDCYDYWVDTNSPYIHPCGWHEGRQQLIVPPDFENSAFSWPDFLREHGSGLVAPATLFNPRDPIDFKPKMKLEVVDPRNPILIRPATVVARKNHRIKLHLDLWPNEYCFWLEDDSPDLHPIGWCDATGHALEPPPGFQSRTALMPCSTAGCRGIGNAKQSNLNTHSTRDCCPYTPENWNVKLEKLPRVENNEIERKISAKAAHLEQQNASIKPRNEVLRTRRSYEQRNSTTKPTNTFADTIIERLSLLDTIKTRRSLQEQQHKVPKRVDIVEEDNLHKTFVLKHELNDDVVRKEKSKVSVNIDKSNSAESLSIQIAKEYLYDYGPRLKQNYNFWQHNLSTDFDDITKNPLHWTTQESSLFVEKLLNCSKTAHRFEREDIDGTALLALQQSDLTDLLHIKLGPAVKLYAHILQLRTWTVAKFNVQSALSD